MMDRGQEALDSNDPDEDAAAYFRRAVELRPGNAEAQGKLAFARAADVEEAKPAEVRRFLAEAQRATAAALALHPKEPNAQLAQTVIEGGLLDLSTTEDRLRRILAADPSNLQAMKLLWNLLQCVGRSREALGLVNRALQLKPLASGNHYPCAQLLWIVGRTAEADRVIDKAMQYWPTHRYVRFARFIIFAFTNRPRAALAMIEKPETAPQNYSPEAIALWRVSLAAMDQPTTARIAAARRANLNAVEKNLRLTSQATMVMAALGEVDTAFEFANAFFAVGHSTHERADTGRPAKSTAWRFAPWLFTPPIAPLRADPRFQTLVDAIGLTDYWTSHRVQPDYKRFG
jgi:tetratricopeptide (TPR) repeat protein